MNTQEEWYEPTDYRFYSEHEPLSDYDLARHTELFHPSLATLLRRLARRVVAFLL
jgi:hypothetical protein